MNHLKFTIRIPEATHEYLIAELLDLDFYGFEQEEDTLTAYIQASHWNDVYREDLERLISHFPGSSLTATEEIEPRNWNEEWEKTIKPIEVGRFLVTPSWHASHLDQDKIQIIVDPKMSFGTGYHPTTRLMLRALERLDCRGTSVIDAGSGSGILGIAAAKLGASLVFAFDIDPVCYENAIENAERNGVSAMSVQTGGISDVEIPVKADITMANIHLAVLKHHLGDLKDWTKPDGYVLLSGLLETDIGEICESASAAGLELLQKDQEEEWICCKFRSTI